MKTNGTWWKLKENYYLLVLYTQGGDNQRAVRDDI